jgi:3-hydroxyanthranilate 3,4-dioxygenase
MWLFSVSAISIEKKKRKMSELLVKENIDAWYETHKEQFAPPVCNKLMHRNQLTAMFVGGPNTRTDFHLDQSSEFFYQMRGNMHLPIIEHGGQRRVVHIRQGQVFLLPSRVPHSPQRPEEG